jgi:hypothetical protein
MAHIPEVSAAIQAALHDIHLLRFLVKAHDEVAANSILNAYDKALTLQGTDIHEFWICLTERRMNNISAQDLVDCFDRLDGRRSGEARDRRGEWA